MNAAELNLGRHEIIIHFEGEHVDEDGLPLDELLVSMEGWREYLLLCSTLYVRGTLNSNPLSPESKMSLRVRRIGPGGSLEAVLEWVGLAIAAGVVGNRADALVTTAGKELWKLCAGLFKAHVTAKQGFLSTQEVAARLEQLASEIGIRVDEESNPEDIVALVDESLKRASVPVGSSAESIRLEATGSVESISLTRDDKQAIDAEFNDKPQVVDVGEPIQVMVRFVSINVPKKTAAVKFDNPKDASQRGIRSCRIVDVEVLAKPRDPYTKSLYEREPVKVWARKVIFNSESGASRWDISKNPPPKPDPTLFDE